MSVTVSTQLAIPSVRTALLRMGTVAAFLRETTATALVHTTALPLIVASSKLADPHLTTLLDTR